MIKLLIFSIICIIISVLLFLNYNNGLGGPLSSFKKKFVLSLSILAFVGFIIFGNKAYYYSDITKCKQIINELKKEYNDLDTMISKESVGENPEIRDKQSQIRNLLYKIDPEEFKEYDTYASMITNILIAFVAFIIAFTFKNKILDSQN